MGDVQGKGRKATSDLLVNILTQRGSLEKLTEYFLEGKFLFAKIVLAKVPRSKCIWFRKESSVDL